MDPVSIDTLVQFGRANGWIPALALIVGAIIRASKDDPFAARIPFFYIRPENRAIWAMLFGIALAAFRLLAGSTWYDAIAGGIVAGSLAIAGHEIVVKRLRKGRDIGIKKDPPGPPPNPWTDDSLRPPAGYPMPTITEVPYDLRAALAIVGVALAACAPGWNDPHPINPEPGAPCGRVYHECPGGGCCGSNERCGMKGQACDETMCCFTGAAIGAAKNHRPRLSPEDARRGGDGGDRQESRDRDR